mgnify:CR=1 FL=1
MNRAERIEKIKEGYTPRRVEAVQYEAASIQCYLVEVVGEAEVGIYHDLAMDWGLTRKVAYANLAPA